MWRIYIAGTSVSPTIEAWPTKADAELGAANYEEQHPEYFNRLEAREDQPITVSYGKVDQRD